MRGHVLRLLLLCGLCCINITVFAHPLAPALLDVKEISQGHYNILWRQPVTRADFANLIPEFPAQCHPENEGATAIEAVGALTSRWPLDCGPKGLIGQRITITGIEQSVSSVILRIEDTQGRVAQGLIDSDSPQFVIPPPSAPTPVFSRYLQLGTQHLLTGFDHLLFVLGLLLLVRKIRPLIWTITAFTLGHSVTLALATLGIVQMKQSVAELAIAATIVVLALEIVRQQPTSLLRRRPWLMASSFGLIHGLGFAGALAEIGLPSGEIAVALFAFNIGIELGQLLVVLAFFTVLMLVRFARLDAWRLPLVWQDLTAYLMGSCAAYWCIARVMLLINGY